MNWNCEVEVKDGLIATDVTNMRWVRALAALVVLVLISGVVSLATASSAAAATPAEMEQQFSDLANSARRMRGLAPLSADGALAQTSRAWSQSMASAGQLSHDPNLGAVVSAIDPTWTRIAENVGFGGTTNDLWRAFLNSALHKANILGDYNKVGIGVTVDGTGQIWVTFRFVKGSALPPPPGPPPPPAIVNNARYIPLPPTRILDTRNGTGTNGLREPMGQAGVLDLVVLNNGGVPASGASAVVVNFTVTGPTKASHLTVFPRGQSPRPNTSNLNFVPGQTVADLVVARVGSGGMISVFNNAGDVHVIGDVVGYFNDGTPAGARYTAVTPTRLLDTRTGNGAPAAKVGPGATINVQVMGRGPVPGSKVTAVAVNVTATNSTGSSHLTVWQSDLVKPDASNLNFGAGKTVPNMAVVKVSSSGELSFFNNSGSTDVIADVVGFFDDGTTVAAAHTAVAPARVLDTRFGIGSSGKVGPGQTRSVLIRGQGGVSQSATAVVLTVTATNATVDSHVTVSPTGVTVPDASNLNFVGGQTVPNLVIVGIGSDGRINMFNKSGSVDLLADVVGYMA